MKKIAILGSTGSIGRNALNVISKFPDRFKITGLTAGKNIALLIDQINSFHPEVVAVSDEETYGALKSAMSDRHRSTKVLHGVEGICSVAAMPEADIVISAIVGSAGLLPTISAIRAGKAIALANKETLVMAGDIVMSEVKKSGVSLLPVDSEHSAIFQCMNGCPINSIRRLILTASGGPFIGKTLKELGDVRPEDALKHPNWSMGRKISIDSATLMNKGLEVIEAHHLFEMPADRIDVLVHPQSIVHSIVEFKDGSCTAQLSNPDMKGPIAYALSWPERLPEVMKPLEWEKLSGLTFHKPDNKTFPSLALAYSALDAGGTMPAVLNASNETAVNAFLDRVIGFTDIPVIIKKVLDSHKLQRADDIETVLEADKWARKETTKELNK